MSRQSTSLRVELETLDQVILDVSSAMIERSPSKRVAGSDVWQHVRVVVPDLAPVI